MRRQFSSLYHLSASAKASYDDLSYLSEWGDSRYRQTEVQLNSSHKFSVCKWFDASFAVDFQWDGLRSDTYGKERASVFATATAAFHTGRLSADVALEYSGTFDKGGQGAERRFAFSRPSLARRRRLLCHRLCPQGVQDADLQ